MNTLLEQAKAAAAKLKDQTDEGGGNFEYEPPAAGPCVGRFVSYVEIGKMPQQPFKGTAKPPAPECIVEFQLLGKKHAKQIETEDEDGNKVTKTFYPIIRIGRGPSASEGKAVGNGMTLPAGAKSNSYKLLKAMDYGRGNTNMAFMLGELFLLNVIHNEVEKEVNGKKTKQVFANLRDDQGVWQVKAPLIQKFDDMGEPVGDPQPVKITLPPEAVEPRMLLWDAPSIEQWKSIYVDGTYTKQVGDKEVTVSKNWLQQTVKNAVNFEGSGIQAIIAAEEGDLPEVSEDEITEAPETPAEADPVEDAVVVPAEDETPATEAPVAPEDEDDPLASLGL